MKRKLKNYLLVAVLGVLPMKSFGSYEVVSSLDYGVAWSQNGAGTGSEDIVEGYGDNIPLELALKQVTPNGWDLLFTESVDKSKIVSWRGNKPWSQIMKQLADQAGLIVEIQPDGHNILISNSSHANGLGAVIHKFSSSNRKLFTMEAKVWNLTQGEKLSRNLRQWGDSIGWNVVWELDNDFIVEVPVTMTGSLKGAIDKLLEAYREQRILLHVVATVHPHNKTIQIHQKMVK